MDPYRSSVLENLRIDKEGAKFALDGREVRIPGDVSSPSVYAFNTLIIEAYAAYGVHQRRQEAGLVARLGSWFGRVFRGSGTAEDHTGLTDVRVGRPYVGESAAAQPASGGRSGQAKVGLRDDGAGSPTAAVFQAVYAAKDGVHVFWRQPAEGKEGKPGAKRAVQTTELVFALDSEMARKLQGCYRELEKLGYKTTGFDALSTVNDKATAAAEARPEAETPAEQSKAKAAAVMTPPIVPTVRDAAHAVKTTNSNGSGPDSKDSAPKPVVMRLHPTPPDPAARALVSPIDDANKPEVLVAPERVLRALRLAGESSRPIEKRLTFLRCTKGETGLKITEVGFGAAQGNDREPARWEDAKNWWDEKGKALAATSPPMPTATPPSPVTAATIPGPSFSPGSSPLTVGREPALPGSM